MDESISSLLGLIFGSSIPLWSFVIAWVTVLLISLYALVRGSDTFLEGAKQMGASLGLSRLAIGILIVGFGTSLPELATSISAALKDETAVVIATTMGSNIAHILLVIGALTAIGGGVVLRRKLLHTGMPIFFIATVHYLFILKDGYVDRLEALLLIGTFAAYIWYLVHEAKVEDNVKMLHGGPKPHLRFQSLTFIALGISAILVGANFAVDMVVNLATSFAVPLGLVSIAAIGIGANLPELFVALRSIKMKEQELAIGNIFGSHTFNILTTTGAAALITPLVADKVVMELAIYVFMAASAIFFVSCLARQILRWEGMMMVLFFVFFLIKLTEFL